LPGRIERDIEPAPAPLAVPPATTVQPSAPLAPRTGGGPQFVLKDVIVEGASVYSPGELRAEYASLIDKTISVEQITEIEEAIGRKYRRDGYILARAIAPADQSIDPNAGIVKIQVIEGFIDKVRLDPLDYEVGEKGALIKSTLKRIERACRPGDEPRDGKPCPLHASTLERYLLLTNDLPGVKATAVIQPSVDASGGADLFVTINEKWYAGFAKVDNRGSVYTGPFRGDVGGSLNNMTGFYERSSVRVIAAKPLDELLLWDVIEEIPISNEGTRLGLDFSRSDSKPGDILRSLSVRTHTKSGNVTVTHPLIRTRSENLFIRGGFEFRNSDNQASDLPVSEDRTRAIAFGATYDLADRYLGINLADVKFTHGLPIFHASAASDVVHTSRAGIDATGDFSKISTELSRLQRVLPELNILAAVTGQYSFSNLVTAEEYGFGGDRYGRGYDSSEVLGDHGIGSKLELQYNPTGVGDVLGLIELPPSLLRSIQLYSFYDFGMVWQRPSNKLLASLASTQHDRQSAASVGGGIRFNVNDWVTGYFEIAKPLTRAIASEVAKSEDGRAPRYFFSLATSF
jgi:hemolysin activation/secretion protein